MLAPPFFSGFCQSHAAITFDVQVKSLFIKLYRMGIQRLIIMRPRTRNNIGRKKESNRIEAICEMANKINQRMSTILSTNFNVELIIVTYLKTAGIGISISRQAPSNSIRHDRSGQNGRKSKHPEA